MLRGVSVDAELQSSKLYRAMDSGERAEGSRRRSRCPGLPKPVGGDALFGSSIAAAKRKVNKRQVQGKQRIKSNVTNRGASCRPAFGSGSQSAIVRNRWEVSVGFRSRRPDNRARTSFALNGLG